MTSYGRATAFILGVPLASCGGNSPGLDSSAPAREPSADSASSEQPSAPDDANVAEEADLYGAIVDGGGRHSGQATTEDAAALPQGRIVYVSERNALVSLWTMASDGSDAAQLTHGRESTPSPSESKPESWPRWSPSGRQVAFARSVAGKMQIFVINADGTGERQLTDDAESNLMPAWSPDGSQLLFVCRELKAGMTPTGDLCIQRLDSTEKTKLSGTLVPKAVSLSSSDAVPPLGPVSTDWGMGSAGILWWNFGGYGGGALCLKYGCYQPLVLPPSGAVPTVSGGTISASQTIYGARWRPNGSGFVSAVLGQLDSGIHLLFGDSQPVFDPDEPYRDAFPSWSKNGRHLVFQSNRSGRTQIYWTEFDPASLPMNSQNIHQVTKDEYENSEPDFYTDSASVDLGSASAM